jgi:hypothetical protein
MSEMREPAVVIGINDSSKADGMMMLPSGETRPAIDLSSHITRVRVDRGKTGESACPSSRSGGYRRCDLTDGHLGDHEARAGRTGVVTWR